MNTYTFLQNTFEPPQRPRKNQIKIKRLYNNYEACKNCKNKKTNTVHPHKHTKPSQNTDQKYKKQWTTKCKNKNIKDEHAKRSSVEGPFGIFKEQFQIEKEVVVGMVKTEERINLDALAYNLIRLYNIKQEIENTAEYLEDFCESTSIKNQLKLDVTIF